MDAEAESSMVHRWECHCGMPPILLGTFDEAGNVYVSIRKRHYHMIGRITATCPRCGAVRHRPPERPRS